MAPERRFRLGYNTCGFARTGDVGEILRTLREIGYEGVEISLDKIHYHPYFSPPSELAGLKEALRETGLANVLATGARYVLSETKHEPSIISPDSSARREWKEFLLASISLAEDLGSSCVMLHSGYLQQGVDPEQAWRWMVETVRELCRFAEVHGQRLAMEFHPDMFVRTFEDYRKLKQEVRCANFGLTLDVGHVACTEASPAHALALDAADEIYNIHLDDIRGGIHRHLPLGQGEIDFASLFHALATTGYCGLASVELNSGDLQVDEKELARDTYDHLHRVFPFKNPLELNLS